MTARRTSGHGPTHPAGNRRRRRTQEQNAACQAQAYFLKTSGAMSFDRIAASADPTGTAPTLYSNASSARAGYLAHAQRVRGTKEESPLSVTERRALQGDRFERILQAWLPRCLAGSEGAAVIVLRALAGQRELHGLNQRAAAPDLDKGPEDIADELAERRAASREAARAAALRVTAAATPPPAPED